MTALELSMSGELPKFGEAVDDREFSIVRKGYDRDEVKAYLKEIEASLRQLEAWAQHTNARLSRAEEKNRAIDDVDQAMLAVFENRGRVLEEARLEAEKIETEANQRARAEAEVIAAQIVDDARADARRISETALAATTSPSAESILAAARAEADRMLQAARAESDRLIDDARAQNARLSSNDVEDASPQIQDRSLGSASIARLIVDMEGDTKASSELSDT